MCHSLDYITLHASILDRAGWEKTVGKMINIMVRPSMMRQTDHHRLSGTELRK